MFPVPDKLQVQERAAVPTFESAADNDHQAEPDMPPAGRLADTIARLVPGAVGVFAILHVQELGVGSLQEPQPGFWPLVLSVLLILISLIMVIAGNRLKRGESFQRGALEVLAGAATLAVFALVIEYVGFELPAVLMMLYWLRVLGRESWRTSLIVSAATVTAFYLVFIIALRTTVPHLINF
jgi:putative tricarboxylic transport membrane protein